MHYIVQIDRELLEVNRAEGHLLESVHFESRIDPCEVLTQGKDIFLSISF